MFVQKGILDFTEETTSLFIRKGYRQILFDTFFNSLNIYLVKKYIGQNKVRLIIDAENYESIHLYYSLNNKLRVLNSTKINENTYEFDISYLEEKGTIYPVIKGDVDKIKVNSFRYEIDCESREISPCVLITTYNRQEFLIPNLEKLNKCEGLAHVIVVDNAKNVELPKSLDSKKFTVIPNDNLGGTGGFTRGMMEAKKRGFSHIFIMDDDITLIPEVMEKTFSLVASLKEEHKNDWVGYSMLIRDNPLVQYELGTKWNGYRMNLNHHNYQLNRPKYLIKNQINKKPNYSAWWSLMMPIEVLDKYGYPCPFFIKFDDIEYALRRENEEIILTNGFGVWHESFEKKFNPYLEYYLVRNAFVTNSLHMKNPGFKSAWRYFRKSVKFYLLGRHREFKLINIGTNDFFKGPDYLLSLDLEANNNKMREIAKEKPNFVKGLFTIPFISCFYFFKIWFGFNKPKKAYLSKKNDLTSGEYWEKIFNHE